MTPPIRPQPPYEHLDLRVDPEPIDDGGRPWALLIFAAIVFLAVVAVLVREVPRPAPESHSPGPHILALDGAPRRAGGPPPFDPPSTIGMRPASSGVPAASLPPAGLPDTDTVGSVGVSGTATWYCRPGVSACTRGFPSSGPYAAAGSELRTPGWRGRWVLVCAGRCVQARLVDACACPGSRVIDLYASVFRKLAPLSAGLVRVRVAFLADPDVVLPATDMEGDSE